VTLIEKGWLQLFPKIYDAEFHAQSAAAVASFEATRIAQLLGAEAKEKSSSVGARQRSQRDYAIRARQQPSVAAHELEKLQKEGERENSGPQQQSANPGAGLYYDRWNCTRCRK